MIAFIINNYEILDETHQYLTKIKLVKYYFIFNIQEIQLSSNQIQKLFIYNNKSFYCSKYQNLTMLSRDENLKNCVVKIK